MCPVDLQPTVVETSNEEAYVPVAIRPKSNGNVWGNKWMEGTKDVGVYGRKAPGDVGVCGRKAPGDVRVSIL